MPVAPGTRLGPYEIVGQIGAGGMGEVWKARDPKLGRLVAIKVLPADFAADASRLKRFQQEAKVLAAVNHPNLVHIYEAGEHEGTPYLVMELLEGETLREKIVGRPLAIKRAAEVARETALGLAAAHERGILHRDLKPENLFLTKDGRVKILDFGLAKYEALKPIGQESETRAFLSEPGTVLGTSAYMSPEQVRGEVLDPRSDLFCLGVILWEMLTGIRPFQGNSSVEVMNAILHNDPPELDPALKVTPGLSRILDACLAKDPYARFHSAHDLAFALEATHGSGTSSTFGLKIESGRAPGTFGRWAGLGAMLILTVILVVGSLAYFRHWPPFENPIQPTFTRLTFRKGNLLGAHFAPDGRTIVYCATWDGKPSDIYSVRTDTLESRPLGLPPGSGLQSVSSKGELAIILGGKGTLARVPLTGGTPRELLERSLAAWSPNGQELAVFRRAQGKWRLEYPIGNALYETNNEVRWLRVSPSGRKLAFVESLPGGVEQILRVVGTDQQVQTLSFGPGVMWGLAWKPDEQHLVTNWGNMQTSLPLWEVSLKGERRLLLRGPGGYGIYGIHPDGRWLVEHFITRQEAWLLSNAQTPPKDISWFDRARVRDLSADGRMILFEDQGENGSPRTTWLRTRETRDPVRLCEGIPLGRLSPDGKWAPVLTPGVPPRLQLVPTGPGEAWEVPLEGLSPENLFWHPDGRLFFRAKNAKTQQTGLYASLVGGGRPSLVWEECPAITAVSPDGSMVAAVLDSPNAQGGNVSLMSLQSGSTRAIPLRLEARVRIIQWSLDGKQLILACMQGEDAGRIETFDLATLKRAFLRQLPVNSVDLAWLTGVAITPDGRSMAFSAERVLLSDLYIVEGIR